MISGSNTLGSERSNVGEAAMRLTLAIKTAVNLVLMASCMTTRSRIMEDSKPVVKMNVQQSKATGYLKVSLDANERQLVAVG